ncbi:MAG: hypothetical protein HY002_00095 [Candidatus Rokubacteria bacterium]|nr:hypothetical protein [Candidatus Rokubacteria bacterium]
MARHGHRRLTRLGAGVLLVGAILLGLVGCAAPQALSPRPDEPAKPPAGAPQAPPREGY